MIQGGKLRSARPAANLNCIFTAAVYISSWSCI
jgi:hypothetical protein